MSWSAGDEYWQSSFWNTVTAKPYSYLVRKEGLYYEAIDAYGKLQYGGSADAGGVSGSDAAAVTQKCVDVTPDGGTVSLHGDIAFQSAVVVQSRDNLTIQFENVSILTDTFAFDVRDSRWIVIRGLNLRFSGSDVRSATQSVIRLWNSSYCVVDVVVLRSLKQNAGVGVELTGDGVTVSNRVVMSYICGSLLAVWLHNIAPGYVNANYIAVTMTYSSVDYEGVKMDASDADMAVSGNYIVDTIFEASGNAGDVGFWNNGRDNVLSNCKAIDLHANAKVAVNSGARFRMIGFSGDVRKFDDTGTSTHLIGVNGAGDYLQMFIIRMPHPLTADWTTSMEGALWYCTTHDKLEFWTGAAIETVTSA